MASVNDGAGRKSAIAFWYAIGDGQQSGVGHNAAIAYPLGQTANRHNGQAAIAGHPDAARRVNHEARYRFIRQRNDARAVAGAKVQEAVAVRADPHTATTIRVQHARDRRGHPILRRVYRKAPGRPARNSAGLPDPERPIRVHRHGFDGTFGDRRPAGQVAPLIVRPNLTDTAIAHANEHPVTRLQERARDHGWKVLHAIRP